jgi:hypothetical protein
MMANSDRLKLVDKLKPNFLFWKVRLCRTFQNKVSGFMKSAILKLVAQDFKPDFSSYRETYSRKKQALSPA